MPDVLDLLMGLDKAKLPEKKVKIKRLSKECGEPVAVSYTHLDVYKRQPSAPHAEGQQDQAVVVDLPGIYSLSPYTSEEIVTRDFLIQEKPDGIINIIDATNIERNLYPVSYTHLSMPRRARRLLVRKRKLWWSSCAL